MFPLCKADQKNKKESINILTSSMITPFVSICSKCIFLGGSSQKKCPRLMLIPKSSHETLFNKKIDGSSKEESMIKAGTKKHVHLCVEM